MFFPETIDLSESEKYTLTVRLQAGSFSFAIYQPGRNDAYVYRGTTFSGNSSYLQQVQRTIFNTSFLSLGYLRTKVEIVSPSYTLVPNQFYDVKEKEHYWNKTSTRANGQILSEPIGMNKEKQLVFEIDRDLYDFLSRNLFSPTFTHHITALEHYFDIDNGRTDLYSRMYIYFSGDQVDILVSRNGQIQTIQSFVGESDQDLFFFAMNIWKATGMDQLNDKLYLSGESYKYGKLIPLFSRFVQHVEQKGAPSEGFLLGEDAIKTPIDLFPLIL